MSESFLHQGMQYSAKDICMRGNKKKNNIGNILFLIKFVFLIQ